MSDDIRDDLPVNPVSLWDGFTAMNDWKSEANERSENFCQTGELPMDFADLVAQGRERIAAKRQAEDAVKAERDRAARFATERHWGALMECVQKALPQCLWPWFNSDLDIELAREEEGTLQFTGGFPDATRSTDHFTLRISPPGCAEIATEFFYHTKESAWKHHVSAVDRYDEGTYRVTVYTTEYTRSDEAKAIVLAVRSRDCIFRNDLPEALALAEEQGREREKLLIECEKENAERESRKAKIKTARQKLIEALADVAEEVVDAVAKEAK
jgi:hypothetical protein